MSDVRWLDASEQRTWRTFLALHQAVYDALERDLQNQAGIPHAYYEILVRLSEAPERELRMSQLAERTMSSRSRLSHAVARLEERGWIQRCAVSDDRRGMLARLTEEGFAALVAIAPGHVEAVRSQLFDKLTPAQVASLREIGEAVLGGPAEF